MKIRIAPSILTADFAHLGEQVALLEKGGADCLHLDIMDGHFVPNLTFGPPVVASLRQVTKLPFDVHLMVEKPERFLEPFAAAGGGSITVHAEVCPHLHRVVREIKNLGLRAGVALNPATPLEVVEYVLDQVDLVLLMTVDPGWGGQRFIEGVCRKIRLLRSRILKERLSVSLQVDGGINPQTFATAVAAGADFLVIGSALFQEGSLEEAVRRFRRKAEEALATSWWAGSQPCTT